MRPGCSDVCARLAVDATLERKICGFTYASAAGNTARQIGPALPAHWRCQECDAPPEQFAVLA